MKFLHDYDLTRFNTFGLNARARYFYELSDLAALPEVLAAAEQQKLPLLLLGGGSNIIFTQNFDGLVLRIATKGIRLLSEDAEHIRIEAAAGENWHRFVQYTLAQGWSGLENLSLIPGTIGAAPVQNIGAYGVEAKDSIESVRCFDLKTKQTVTFNHADCQFAYRDSLFKHAGKDRYLITAVCFRLNKPFTPHIHYGGIEKALETLNLLNQMTPAAVAQAVCSVRQSKLPDPEQLGNAGSFFKNPVISAEAAARLRAQYPDMPQYPAEAGHVKCAAGWLIDQAGLKGFQVGGAAVHHQQALVLVNKDHHATAQDVIQLAAHIQKVIQEKFGISLEPEPLFVS